MHAKIDGELSNFLPVTIKNSKIMILVSPLLSSDEILYMNSLDLLVKSLLGLSFCLEYLKYVIPV